MEAQGVSLPLSHTVKVALDILPAEQHISLDVVTLFFCDLRILLITRRWFLLQRQSVISAALVVTCGRCELPVSLRVVVGAQHGRLALEAYMARVILYHTLRSLSCTIAASASAPS